MKTTSNKDLDRLLKKYKNYGGTFSKNTLPKKLEDSKFYVINLDDEEGTHWVLMYPMKNRKKYFYFDSFAGPPPKSISSKIGVYNHLKVQHLLSASCGYFVVYMVEQLEKGRKFFDILLHDFSPTDYERNEEFIANYYKK